MIWSALCCALLATQACLAPGDIDDPEAFLARIGRGDGGPISGDAAVGAGDGGTSNDASAAPNPCDAVVTDLLKTCQASVCHGTDSSSPLNLEAAGLPDRLVGQKSSTMCAERLYIDPQSPKDSLLLGKLTTKPPCGSPMPLGGKTPTDAQRTCVLEWITAAVDGDAATKPSGMDAGMSGMDAGAAAGADKCVDDKDKTEPGECGCGVPDDDTDGDGAFDCKDACDADPLHTAAPCDVPGLLVGSLMGNPNTADDNPGNMGVDALGMTMTEETDWPEQTTLVFTGRIQITASGAVSFYENIDDAVRLTVDGMMVLSNDTWDEPTAGTIKRAPGWYDFELRVSNGATASGPPPGAGIGFGYSPMDRAGSTNAADYKHPANSSATNGDLFLTTKP